MIGAKPLSGKGLGLSSAIRNSTDSERHEDVSITSLERPSEESSMVDLDYTWKKLGIVPESTKIEAKSKSKSGLVLEYLSLFPETGLAGGTVYNFVRNFCKENDIQLIERDVVYATLRRLWKIEKLERFKRDDVYWYRLVKETK